MAHRAEHKPGPRVSDLSNQRRVTGEAAYGNPPAPSAAAALEKLVTATQGVITKRIDLLALETHELVSGLLLKAAFGSFGVIVALAAWFSGIAALVTWVLDGWDPSAQLGAFAGINAVVGAAVGYFALREAPQTPTEIAEQHQEEDHGGEQQREVEEASYREERDESRLH